MIRIANARDFIVDGKMVLPENAVYCGRTNGRYGLTAGPLANPCRVLGPADHMHKLAVKVFRSWLGERIQANDLTVGRELARLRALAAKGDLVLVCWCETWDGTGYPPGRCHTEIIRDRILVPDGGDRA